MDEDFHPIQAWAPGSDSVHESNPREDVAKADDAVLEETKAWEGLVPRQEGQEWLSVRLELLVEAVANDGQQLSTFGDGWHPDLSEAVAKGRRELSLAKVSTGVHGRHHKKVL